MRVLTVVEDLDRGGTQRVAAAFAQLYREAGHDSAVLTYYGGGHRVAALQAGGVEVFAGSREPEPMRRATRAALEWGATAVHLHRPGLADPITGGILRDILKKNAVRGPRLGVIETNVFARVDYSADRELIDIHAQLSRWCLWKWRRWASSCRPPPVGAVLPNVVIPDGFRALEPAERQVARERLGLPRAAFVVGRVGSALMPKWSVHTVEAFRRLAEARNDVWMLLVGMPNELRAHIAGLEPGVRARVVDVPYVSGDGALREVYGSMDVQLHSSEIGESFGMVLAEAMLCEVPCVTLATPVKDNSQGEVVGHERGGLVAASTDGMVAAVERLFRDPGLRARLGAQGREHILASFSPGVVVPVALRLLEMACAWGGDRPRLERELRNSGDLPEVTGRDIRRAMRACVGRYGLRTRTLFPLVSNPRVYRAYRALRGMS